MKKIFVPGSKEKKRHDSGFVLMQAVLLIFVLSLVMAATVELLSGQLQLLEKKTALLNQQYEIKEAANESL